MDTITKNPLQKKRDTKNKIETKIQQDKTTQNKTKHKRANSKHEKRKYPKTGSSTKICKRLGFYAICNRHKKANSNARIESA